MLRDSRSIFYLLRFVITDNLAAGCCCHRTGWISQSSGPVFALMCWKQPEHRLLPASTCAIFHLSGSTVLLGSRLTTGAEMAKTRRETYLHGEKFQQNMFALGFLCELRCFLT